MKLRPALKQNQQVWRVCVCVCASVTQQKTLKCFVGTVCLLGQDQPYVRGALNFPRAASAVRTQQRWQFWADEEFFTARPRAFSQLHTAAVLQLETLYRSLSATSVRIKKRVLVLTPALWEEDAEDELLPGNLNVFGLLTQICQKT